MYITIFPSYYHASTYFQVLASAFYFILFLPVILVHLFRGKNNKTFRSFSLHRWDKNPLIRLSRKKEEIKALVHMSTSCVFNRHKNSRKETLLKLMPNEGYQLHDEISFSHLIGFFFLLLLFHITKKLRLNMFLLLFCFRKYNIRKEIGVCLLFLFTLHSSKGNKKK